MGNRSESNWVSLSAAFIRAEADYTETDNIGSLSEIQRAAAVTLGIIGFRSVSFAQIERRGQVSDDKKLTLQVLLLLAPMLQTLVSVMRSP